jgi:hypothetical protein
VSNPWAAWLRAYGTDRYVLGEKAGWDRFVNGAARENFEVLSRSQMARLNEDELEDYNEARRVWNTNLPTVRTPQMERANEIIDMVMASARRDGDKLRGSAVIDAEAGLGKTTIATTYGRAYHRAQYRRYGATTAEGHQFLPVAYIGLSSAITLKGLNQRLLRFYGHPAAERATKDRLATLLLDCVRACETRIIIIDELQFVDFGNTRGVELSNHLKWLANELPVTFMFAGVGLQSRKFFSEGLSPSEEVYAQTARRATRVPVAPFTISTNAGMIAWVALLRSFGAHIKLAEGDTEMLVPFAQEIHRRTQGRLVSLTTLLDRVCHMAVKTGTERVTDEVLGKVLIDNAGENGARRA